MKRNKDIKFIIYQTLYILVISIMALKNANLDLETVIDAKDVVEKTYADSIKAKLDSLLDLGLRPELLLDTSKFTPVEKEKYTNLLKIQNQFISVRTNPTEHFEPVIPTLTDVKEINFIKDVKAEQNLPDQNTNLDERVPLLDYVSKLNLIQYTIQSFKNPFDKEMTFAGKVIPPKTTVSIQLGGDNMQEIKVGKQTAAVNIKPNQRPKIFMERMIAMGEDVRVKDLDNAKVCYRVTIVDDCPEQLEVKFGGPVTVKTIEKNKKYDITLNFLRSKVEFDAWTDRQSYPYTVGFTVTVVDPIARHSESAQNNFVFGQW